MTDRIPLSRATSTSSTSSNDELVSLVEQSIHYTPPTRCTKPSYNIIEDRINMNHFNTIKIIYIKSAMIALETLKKQDSDYLWEPLFERWENIKQLAKKNPDLKLKSIPIKRPISMKGFAFNMKNPIFKSFSCVIAKTTESPFQTSLYKNQQLHDQYTLSTRN